MTPAPWTVYHFVTPSTRGEFAPQDAGIFEVEEINEEINALIAEGLPHEAEALADRVKAKIAALPLLVSALDNLQANPNDPRAHRAALDALAAAKGEP